MGVPNGSSSNGHVSAAKYNIPSHFIGGNHLDAAPPSSVKDFVANHEGHSVISSVSGNLRGSETTKVFRSHQHSTISLTSGLALGIGSHRQQRYCRRQGDSIGPEMGLRNIRQRACHSVHGHGHTGRFAGKCGLHPYG